MGDFGAVFALGVVARSVIELADLESGGSMAAVADRADVRAPVRADPAEARGDGEADAILPIQNRGPSLVGMAGFDVADGCWELGVKGRLGWWVGWG